MGKKLYVGNLDVTVTDSDLQRLFSAHGAILSTRVATDLDTNQSRGFGFVEMATDGEAQAAIAALNGKDHGGRALKVKEAKPKAAKTKSASAPATAAVGNAPW